MWILGCFVGVFAGLGIIYVVKSAINMIKVLRNRRSGNIVCNVAVNIPKKVQDNLDNKINRRQDLTFTKSLVGKTITIDEEKYIVILILTLSVPGQDRYDGEFRLLLYSRGKLAWKTINSVEHYDLYEKFCAPKPLRSREIRRDVRKFCNSSCILDCTDCILKKYGKPKGNQAK